LRQRFTSASGIPRAGREAPNESQVRKIEQDRNAIQTAQAAGIGKITPVATTAGVRAVHITAISSAGPIAAITSVTSVTSIGSTPGPSRIAEIEQKKHARER
jgi:hypothetical protein